MGKYRGSDGWLNDDGVDDPHRYKSTENTQKPAPKKGKPQPELTVCPNCSMSYSWRRKERYCASCGWGKPETPESEKKGDDGSVYCCFVVAALIILPLLGMGMGYGFGGFGGLLAGGALGLAVPVGVMAYAISSAEKHKKGEAQ